MTKDDVIRLADKCGLIDYLELDGDSVGLSMIEAFAKLVAEHEREACALESENCGAIHVAKRIRARKES